MDTLVEYLRGMKQVDIMYGTGKIMFLIEYFGKLQHVRSVEKVFGRP